MTKGNSNKSFQRSGDMLRSAQQVIPLGAQTFSKSFLQWPEGVSPLFIESGKGSKVHDVDGNQYIDFVNALMAISLGHCDEDVSKAVKEQIDIGTIFSLSNKIEQDVARMIIERVPCAEMVRFGKNGSDATAGAIRIARAHTKKDRVAVCGYHGWQDWYIGSTARHKGVPDAVRELTHSFIYNDLDSLKNLLKTYKSEFAAIIIEPMNNEFPEDGFLQKLIDLGRQENVVVIFDETITGFRFARGGAQEYFNVTPDMATFGKGMTNGYPLSAITGAAKFMKECEEVFFSFTMGGEALSLAAAKATMKKLDRVNAYVHLQNLGEVLKKEGRSLIKKHGCDKFIEIKGHPAWSFIAFSDHENASLWQIKSLWQQECIKRGILCQGTHNLTFAHSNEDIESLLNVYDEVFPILQRSVSDNTIMDLLNAPPIENLFKVR